MVEQARNPQPVIVIVSDGEDNLSGTTIAELASTRRQSETLVYGVLTDRRPSPYTAMTPLARVRPADALPDIVGTGGALFRATDAASAQAAAVALIDDLRAQYTIGFSSKKSRDGQYHRLRIELVNPALTPRYREGYLATPQ
jgi:hypothetical protein